MRRLHLVYGDLNDASSLNQILRTVQPDEIYNLGAQSHVRVSFDIPEYTGEITGLGTVRSAGGDSRVRIAAQVLPSLVERNVRQGAGGAADGKRRRSTRGVRMARPRCMRTGLR